MSLQVVEFLAMAQAVKPAKQQGSHLLLCEPGGLEGKNEADSKRSSSDMTVPSYRVALRGRAAEIEYNQVERPEQLELENINPM